MKHVDEYRDPVRVTALRNALAREVTRPWTIMEVCGGQTHAILRFGLDRMLPEGVELLHGPGCPVCVTPAEQIDAAIAIASEPDVIMCTFGDMIRVPGTDISLAMAKARGADVRVVYSPLDAMNLAAAEPGREVVFFAIGFETTVPTTAMAVYQARTMGLSNFSLLVSHVRVPPALEVLLQTPGTRIDAFLAAGHVCTVMGLHEYAPIVSRHDTPIVATGFEPVDILEGVLMCVRQLETGEARLENQYARAVQRTGNAHAQRIMDEVFEVAGQSWRGIGPISASGLRLRAHWQAFDAARRFPPTPGTEPASPDTPCISGEVLSGRKRPTACSAFGTRCTPAHPLGAPMVSAEGACAAYYSYARFAE